MRQMKKSPVIIAFSAGLLLVILVCLPGCKNPPAKKEKTLFTFAYMTDIHLCPERNAVAGFKKAIETVNKLHPDFVLTGGDLIMDALGQSWGRADSLYKLYQEACRDFKEPVYNTMGNHEIYGIFRRSGADRNNPEYGEKMYENRLGPSYYSFEHKGWKFMILNSIEDNGKGGYIGLVDSLQMDWIRKELQATDTATPIILSTHIPLIMAFTQRYYGSTVPNDSALVVVNSKEVLDLFKGYNLKLVLQGHLHTVEDVYIDGIHFLISGAVSAAWWTGPHFGYQEGFMLLTVRKNSVDWEYVDYGWEIN
jgi:3',5'-cyclic AMP phosphodiesterase CpdA